MDALIKKWKLIADKFHKAGMKADHNPIQQEGLLCRVEVYDYCADELEFFKLRKGESIK